MREQVQERTHIGPPDAGDAAGTTSAKLALSSARDLMAVGSGKSTAGTRPDPDSNSQRTGFLYSIFAGGVSGSTYSSVIDIYNHSASAFAANAGLSLPRSTAAVACSGQFAQIVILFRLSLPPHQILPHLWWSRRCQRLQPHRHSLPRQHDDRSWCRSLLQPSESRFCFSRPLHLRCRRCSDDVKLFRRNQAGTLHLLH